MNESKKALAVAHLDRMVKEGRYLDCGAHISLPVLHSLKIASDALKERKTGKWIDHREEGYVECPLCGHLTTCWGGIEDLHYCFWCGERLTIPNTAAADPCDNDCEHCDWATCPKEEADE